jgi:hypothetical protein
MATEKLTGIDNGVISSEEWYDRYQPLEDKSNGLKVY